MSNLVFDESSSNREASHGYAWWFSGDTFEKAMAEDRKPRKRGLTRRLVNHPGRLTIFYFLTLAALSTTLLMTPIATPKDETTTFTTAFFTAVSAISTCGMPNQKKTGSIKRCKKTNKDSTKIWLQAQKKNWMQSSKI